MKVGDVMMLMLDCLGYQHGSGTLLWQNIAVLDSNPLHHCHTSKVEEIVLILVPLYLFIEVEVGVGLPSNWEVLYQVFYTCRAKLRIQNQRVSGNFSGSVP